MSTDYTLEFPTQAGHYFAKHPDGKVELMRFAAQHHITGRWFVYVLGRRAVEDMLPSTMRGVLFLGPFTYETVAAGLQAREEPTFPTEPGYYGVRWPSNEVKLLELRERYKDTEDWVTWFPDVPSPMLMTDVPDAGLLYLGPFTDKTVLAGFRAAEQEGEEAPAQAEEDIRDALGIPPEFFKGKDT